MFDALWLNAGAWGLIVSAGLIAGAAFGVFGPLEHRGIARVMALGAGLLIAAATLELVGESLRQLGAAATGMSFLAGAGTYSLVNLWLARRNAKHRKRCGVCVAQPTEGGAPGSGLAIAIGTLLDGVPEGAVLGLELARSGQPGWPLIIGFALGNFAEATSSAAGMWTAKRSNRYIFTVWFAVAIAVAVAAAVAAAISERMPAGSVGMCNAFAAGALVAMIIETMVPEASHGTPPLNGLVTAAGFVLLMLLIGA